MDIAIAQNPAFSWLAAFIQKPKNEMRKFHKKPVFRQPRCYAYKKSTAVQYAWGEMMKNNAGNFVELIDFVRTKASRLKSNVDIATTILTLAGEIEYKDSLDMLSQKETVLLEGFVKNGVVTTKDNENELKYKFIIKKYGRVMIVDTDFDSSQYFTIYDFSIDSNYLSARNDKVNKEEINKIRNYYLTHGDIVKDCQKIVQAIRHTSPVIYFLGLNTYTNFYSLGDKELRSNEKDILVALEQVNKTRLLDISDDLIILIFVLSVVHISGHVSRFEEINSKQISLNLLNSFLLRKRNLYSIKANTLIYPEDMVSAANKIHEQYTTMLKSKFIYRIINGFTLSKIEYVTKENINLVQADNSKLMETVVWNYLANHGIRANSLEFGVASLLHQYFNNAFNSKFSFAIEELIHLVIEKSMSMLSSDYSMTRTFKKFSNLIAITKKYNSTSSLHEILKLKPSDFLCYTLPSDSIINENSQDFLLKSLNGISGRMRFNGWHYFAGNFSSDMPDSRDYYSPPKAIDMALSDNYHHTGHTTFSVNTSIKIPMPLTVANKTYDALMDYRVMRIIPNQYSVQELKIAYGTTCVLQKIYQQLIEYLEETGSRFEFNFASKMWYQETYGKRQ
ncbi:MAG: hypothetical protein VSS52_007940 [Thiotrichaceae bacterium]|nr:hypothetical protein [Thiotrichaceae bacterium]